VAVAAPVRRFVEPGPIEAAQAVVDGAGRLREAIPDTMRGFAALGAGTSRAGALEPKFKELIALGISIALDDFGTGYSSLSYLRRLPVDTLKIDRSFVVRMRDAGYPRNIVAMIVSLAHTLGLKVIAEGVEDDEQVRLLRDLGCDQIQGYLVSRPVPAQEIEKILQRAVESRTAA